MPTPQPSKLRIFFPSKYLAADGDGLTMFVADAGSTTTTIVDAFLSEAADYWNGAVGWFDGNTTTVALRGQFFHVRDFDSGVLTLSRPLPAAPVAGDTYRLTIGGARRSAFQTFGLSAGGVQPELINIVGPNVSGVTITKCAPLIGNGTLELFFDQSEMLLFARRDPGDFGPGMDVSGDVTDGIVFVGNLNGYVQVDVVTASLPVGDETDTYTLAFPTRTFVPDYEGYETRNTDGGRTRYRLEVVRNTDSLDTMIDLSVYTGRPTGVETAISTGSSIGMVVGSIEIDDPTDWPGGGFWVRNKTVNAGDGDTRYCTYRSGNRLFLREVNWARLSFDAGIDEIERGETVTGGTSGATGVVDQIELTSGSWAVDDAAGIILLKSVTGTFSNDEALTSDGGGSATVDGGATLGLREFTAVSWSAGDTIVVMTDTDIAVANPTGTLFEDPPTPYVSPDGLTYAVSDEQTEAIVVGNVAVGDLAGIWRREWILDPARPRGNVNSDSVWFWS